jgi:hypothetical protein
MVRGLPAYIERSFFEGAHSLRILTRVTPDEDVRGKMLVLHAKHESTSNSRKTFHRMSGSYDLSRGGTGTMALLTDETTKGIFCTTCHCNESGPRAVLVGMCFHQCTSWETGVCRNLGGMGQEKVGVSLAKDVWALSGRFGHSGGIYQSGLYGVDML